MEANNWTPYLITLSWQLPTCLLMLLGLILAIVNIGRHTMPALLALIAFALVLINQLLNAGIMAWHFQIIPHEFDNRGEPLMTVLHGVQTLVSILSWLLILAAIFGWRSARPLSTTSTATSFANSKP